MIYVLGKSIFRNTLYSIGIAENQIEIIKALIKNEIVVGEHWHPKPDIKTIEYWLKFVINNPKILKKLSNKSKKWLMALVLIGLTNLYNQLNLSSGK